MKRALFWLVILALSLLPLAASAETVVGTGVITATGSTCATSGACVRLQTLNTGSGTLEVRGTYSATLLLECTIGGATYTTIPLTPVAGGAPVTSLTGGATGMWSFAGAFGVCQVRASAYTSGTATVNLLATSAKGGGGGSLANPLILPGIAAPGLSAAGVGEIYFDAGGNVFKVSENGGAYTNLLGAVGLLNGNGTPGQLAGWVTDANTLTDATAFAAQLSSLGLGGPAGAASTLKIYGTTSGSVLVTVPATAGTRTFALPAADSNPIVPKDCDALSSGDRVSAISSAGVLSCLPGGGGSGISGLTPGTIPKALTGSTLNDSGLAQDQVAGGSPAPATLAPSIRVFGGGVPTLTTALGANKDLTLVDLTPRLTPRTLTYVDPGVDGPLSASDTFPNIVVTLERTGGVLVSTAGQVRDAIADLEISGVFARLALGSDGSGVVPAMASTAFSGGGDGAQFLQIGEAGQENHIRALFLQGTGDGSPHGGMAPLVIRTDGTPGSQGGMYTYWYRDDLGPDFGVGWYHLAPSLLALSMSIGGDDRGFQFSVEDISNEYFRVGPQEIGLSVYRGGIAPAPPFDDSAALSTYYRSGNAWARATVNTTGAPLYLSPGIGRRFATIVDFSVGAGKTITVTVNGADTVLTEGVNFNAVTSNAVTATNLAVAVNTVTGVSAVAVGADVFVTPVVATRSLDLASNSDPFATVTAGSDGAAFIEGSSAALIIIRPNIKSIELQTDRIQWNQTSSPDPASFLANRSNGTLGSPTTVADGSTIWSLLGRGHDGTDFRDSHQLTLSVDGTPGGGSVPGKWIFDTSGMSGALIIRNTGQIEMAFAASIGPLKTLSLTQGAFGMETMTASAGAPGAAGAKFEVVCGTNAGTAKLVIYAGTSGTAVTVVDNVGAGVTGC